MYKVLKVEGGWSVFRVDSPDTEPVLIPHLVKGEVKPYGKRQAAYRRAKQLNDAEKQIDEMIKRDGAIIL
jgi:hypothetical protein